MLDDAYIIETIDILPHGVDPLAHPFSFLGIPCSSEFPEAL